MFGQSLATKESLDLLSKEFSEFQKMQIHRDAKMDAKMDAYTVSESRAYSEQAKKIDSVIELIKQGHTANKEHNNKLETDLLGRLDRDYYTNIETEAKLVELKNCVRNSFINKDTYEAKIIERDKEITTVKAESKSRIDYLKTLIYVVIISNITVIGMFAWVYVNVIKK